LALSLTLSLYVVSTWRVRERVREREGERESQRQRERAEGNEIVDPENLLLEISSSSSFELKRQKILKAECEIKHCCPCIFNRKSTEMLLK